MSCPAAPTLRRLPSFGVTTALSSQPGEIFDWIAELRGTLPR
jgi:hypothetical protein